MTNTLTLMWHSVGELLYKQDKKYLAGWQSLSVFSAGRQICGLEGVFFVGSGSISAGSCRLVHRGKLPAACTHHSSPSHSSHISRLFAQTFLLQLTFLPLVYSLGSQQLPAAVAGLGRDRQLWFAFARQTQSWKYVFWEGMWPFQFGSKAQSSQEVWDQIFRLTTQTGGVRETLQTFSTRQPVAGFFTPATLLQPDNRCSIKALTWACKIRLTGNKTLF